MYCVSCISATGGSTVVITRDVALERTTDFPSSGPFQIGALNTELDRLTAIAADLDDKAGRALQLTDFDVAASLVLPTVDNRKGKTLAFNAASGAVEAGPTISDVQTVSAAAADIQTLAHIEDGTDATNTIQTVASISSNVSTVAGVSSAVSTVAGISSNVTAVAGDASDIGTVSANISNVNTVAGISANVTTVAGNTTNINTVAGDQTDIGTVATNIADINTAANNITEIQNASTNAATATTKASEAATSATNAATSATTATTKASEASTSASNASTSETNAATSETNAATSATAAAASQTAAAASAASAATAYDSFDDRYLGTKASDPTLDNDGNALVSGALYFSSSENIMKVYDGSSWIAATSAGNVSLTTYQYTATGGQTTFSGSDDNAATLTYTVNNILVTLNGSLLFNGTDYTATNGTSIVLSSGATASDVLQITAFASFTTADMVPASTGGTFAGNVAMTGDLTVDTNTLHIDSTNNQVGIGTSSPDAKLKVVATGANLLVGYSGTQNYFDASENIFRNFAGSERMRITSSGTLQIAGGGNDSVGEINMGNTAQNANRFQVRHQSSAWILKTVDSEPLLFGTANTERMRLDASGNLLVGTTNASLGTGGIQINASGRIGAAASSLSPMVLNRQTSDGTIIDLRKDGSTVGTIGSANSGVNLFIAGTTTGIKITNDNTVSPASTAGSNSDADTDLGASGNRFKDLYLSGGVFLGGTGSANKLDDYEEGTWTPVVADASSGGNTASSYTTNVGFYTKIGRQVTVHCTLTNINTTGMTSSNGVYVQGLPFSHSTTSGRNCTGAMRCDRVNVASDCFGVVALISAGASTAQIFQNRDNLQDETLQVSALVSGQVDLFFTLTYETA